MTKNFEIPENKNGSNGSLHDQISKLGLSADTNWGPAPESKKNRRSHSPKDPEKSKGKTNSRVGKTIKPQNKKAKADENAEKSKSPLFTINFKDRPDLNIYGGEKFNVNKNKYEIINTIQRDGKTLLHVKSLSEKDKFIDLTTEEFLQDFYTGQNGEILFDISESRKQELDTADISDKRKTDKPVDAEAEVWHSSLPEFKIDERAQSYRNDLKQIMDEFEKNPNKNKTSVKKSYSKKLEELKAKYGYGGGKDNYNPNSSNTVKPATPPETVKDEPSENKEGLTLLEPEEKEGNYAEILRLLKFQKENPREPSTVEIEEFLSKYPKLVNVLKKELDNEEVEIQKIYAKDGELLLEYGQKEKQTSYNEKLNNLNTKLELEINEKGDKALEELNHKVESLINQEHNQVLVEPKVPEVTPVISSVTFKLPNLINKIKGWFAKKPNTIDERENTPGFPAYNPGIPEIELRTKENKDEPDIPVMDTKFVAEEINKQIKAQEEASGQKLTPEQKQRLAQEIFLRSKEQLQKDLEANTGGFQKFLKQSREYWQNLDKSRWGKIIKTTTSAAFIGASVLSISALTGSVPVDQINKRFLNRVGFAAGINVIMSSNIFNKYGNALGLNKNNPKLQSGLRNLIMISGLTASAYFGGWAVAGVGLAGTMIKKSLNSYFDKQKAVLENQQKNIKIELEKIEQDTGDFDIEKLSANLKEFEKSYDAVNKSLKNVSWGKNITNNALAIGIGIASYSAYDNLEHSQSHTAGKTTNAHESTDQKIEKDDTPLPQQKPQDITNENYHGFFEKVEKGQGVTQVLKEINEKGHAPEWFHKMLGDNPTPKDFAKFAEQINVYKSGALNDSLVITPGDDIGFNNEGDLILSRGGESYVLAKADDMDGFKVGDWQEKLQNESFMDTDGKGGADITTQENHTENTDTGSHTDISIPAEKPVFQPVYNPKLSEHDVPRFTKPAIEGGDQISNPSEHQDNHAIDNSLKDDIKNGNQEISIENLTPEEKIKINEMYDHNMDVMFDDKKMPSEFIPSIEKVPAEKILSMGDAVVYKGIVDHVKEVRELTGLEPYKANLIHPAETTREYLERGYAKALQLGKLDELKINSNYLPDFKPTKENNYDDAYYDPSNFK